MEAKQPQSLPKGLDLSERTPKKRAARWYAIYKLDLMPFMASCCTLHSKLRRQGVSAL